MASAPTFVAKGNLVTGTGALNVAYPAGLALNDILILQLCTSDAGANTSGAFGGTKIADQGSGGGGSTDCRSTAFWVLSDGTETGTVNVDDAGAATTARMTAWRGVDPTTPIQADINTTFSGSLNTSVNFGFITTTVDNCMVILMHAAGDNNTTSTSAKRNLATITEEYDDVVTTHDDYNMQMQYGVLVSTGVTGAAFTATQVGSEQEANLLFALNPIPDTLQSHIMYIGM